MNQPRSGTCMGRRSTILRRKRRRRCGLSTVEVAVSTLLVGLVGFGAMRVVGGVLQTRAASSSMDARTTLAQSMLAEIAQAKYEDEWNWNWLGPEWGEPWLIAGTRAGYDDVDDYNGWYESPPCPKDSRRGLSDSDGWSRFVQIAWVEPDAPQTSVGWDTGLKRITVTITDPSGRATTHVAFRSTWGAAEQTLSSTTTVQTYVGNELELNSGIEVVSGTNLTNHAQD